MDATARRLTSPSVLFLAAGIVFAITSLFASRVAEPSIDVLVRGTYFAIGHIHMFGIAALVCWLYSGLYYASSRVLHLTINTGLSLVHFAITALALTGLIDLSNPHYLGLGHRESPVYNPPIYNPPLHLLAVSTAALLLVSGLLFFGILLLASMIKLRRRSHI
jgi:heme/copper-type cytochrome/quinol oxidase subunit 1